MLGMTLAKRLATAGCQVTIYEAGSSLGGLADAWQVGPLVWDRHYHVTLLSDQYLVNVLKEIGLGDELVWKETKTGFFTDGKLYSMSNTVEFLRFPPLRLIDRLRLGGTIFYGSKIKNWKRLEKIPVATWLQRWSGKRTFEKIWLPLLRAKLGENYKNTSAAFIWATIARLYAARRTGLKKEMFGYVRGGYQTITTAYEKHLRSLGVSIKLNCPVRSVTVSNTAQETNSNNSSIRITTNEGVFEHTHAALTVPLPLVDSLCPQLSIEEKERNQAIQYQGVLCASFVLKKPLAGYYVTNITDPTIPFTAVIEMTALVDKQSLDSKTLVYLPKYLPSDSNDFLRSDEEIVQEFSAGLQTIYPDIQPSDIVASRVSRARLVMPIPCLNFSEKTPPQETTLPNVFLINAAQIVNGTLNVNETIRLAESAVKNFLTE